MYGRAWLYERRHVYAFGHWVAISRVLGLLGRRYRALVVRACLAELRIALAEWLSNARLLSVAHLRIGVEHLRICESQLRLRESHLHLALTEWRFKSFLWRAVFPFYNEGLRRRRAVLWCSWIAYARARADERGMLAAVSYFLTQLRCGRTLLTWRALALHAGATQRILASALSFAYLRCGRTLTTWRTHALVAAAAKRTHLKSLARWYIECLGLSFRSWAAEMREAAEQRTAMRRFLGRLFVIRRLAGWNAWHELLRQRQRARERTECVTRHQLSGSLRLWRVSNWRSTHDAAVRRELRIAAEALLSHRLALNASVAVVFAWRAWRAALARHSALQHVTRRATRHHSRAVWRAITAAARRRTRLVRAVEIGFRRRSDQALRRALDTWRAASRGARALATSTRRMQAMLSRRAIHRGFASWMLERRNRLAAEVLVTTAVRAAFGRAAGWAVGLWASQTRRAAVAQLANAKYPPPERARLLVVLGRCVGRWRSHTGVAVREDELCRRARTQLCARLLRLVHKRLIALQATVQWRRQSGAAHHPAALNALRTRKRWSVALRRALELGERDGMTYAAPEPLCLIDGLFGAFDALARARLCRLTLEATFRARAFRRWRQESEVRAWQISFVRVALEANLEYGARTAQAALRPNGSEANLEYGARAAPAALQVLQTPMTAGASMAQRRQMSERGLMTDDDELRPSSPHVPDERHPERSSMEMAERSTRLAPRMAPNTALERPLNQASPACSQAPSVASTSTHQAPSVASTLLRGSFIRLDAGGELPQMSEPSAEAEEPVQKQMREPSAEEPVKELMDATRDSSTCMEDSSTGSPTAQFGPAPTTKPIAPWLSSSTSSLLFSPPPAAPRYSRRIP
jgi:hypothetical protein